MARYLGDVWTLTGNVTDINGNAANATAVTVTITDPDGVTAVSGGATSNPSTGTYTYTYAPDKVGMHIAVFTATGTNASVGPVEFYVHPVTVAGIVTLADAKTHLGLTQSDKDARVRAFVLTASDVVENYTGRKFRRTTVAAELHSGGKAALLLHEFPVTSVTTVTESGTAVTTYAADLEAGVLYRSSDRSTAWASGVRNVSVTYVAGSNVVPNDVQQGVLEMVRHLWETQRGGSSFPRQANANDEFDPRTGYTVPRRVSELLDPYRMPGF